MSATLPSPPRRRALTFLSAFPWPLVLFQYLAILPKYDKLFREMGLKLDGWQLFVFDLAGWVRKHTGLSALIVGGLTIATLGVTHYVNSTPRTRRGRTVWLTLAFGVPCLWFALTWLGVQSVHAKLVEGLNK